MAAEYDLGDGLTAFRAGERTFRLDAVAFNNWYAEHPLAGEPGKAGEMLRAVCAKIREEHGVEIGERQAAQLAHACLVEMREIKKKHDEESGSPSSSGSTC